VARLKEQGISTVEQVDRKRAGSFVSWMLNHRSPGWTGDQKTVTKYISSLSSYWRWLERKGHAPSNPWIGQAPPKRKARSIDADTLERPFTDNEVKELLSGPVDAELSDLMWIGALTGARIDAIVSLKVSDCVNGMLRFKPQKKEKSHRFVPIHSDLQELVANRCKGKAPGEYLFHEAPEVPEGSARERSMPISKRFGRYMRARKVAVLLEGKRRSLVNFHSFRRWFVTKAEQAGQPVHIIEAVVGHTRSGMTLGVYSGGPSTEQLRACVESVKLPQ
jgi:integrase